MSLGHSLILVGAAFIALLCTVIVVTFRERRLARAAVTVEAQRASDVRVLIVILAAIPCGMLLTLVTFYLTYVP